MDKLKEDAAAVASVASNIASTDNRVGKKPSKREEEKLLKPKGDKKVEETVTETTETVNEGWKFYQEGDQKIFEIIKEDDFNQFRIGYKKGNRRYWQQNPVLREMMDCMNSEKTRNFVVKFKEGLYNPRLNRF